MKKFLKFTAIGCGGLIVLFIISSILVGFFSSSSEIESADNNTDEELVTTTIDSIQFKKEQEIKDSLVIVEKKKREKAERQLKTFKKNVDEFEGNSFYRDPRTPYYTDVNFIYPYIGEKDDYYWLRLKFQYAADDWLFINKGILLIDGEKFTITGNWERDNDSEIWEWLDIPVGETEYIILDKIANSKSAKIRYVGTQYRNDRIITSKEKSIIGKTLEIYDSLK